MIYENKEAYKKICRRKRLIRLYVNFPNPADAFIDSKESLNLLVLVQIMDDERSHRRAGLRFRRKASKIFAQRWSCIAADYRIIHSEDGNHYLRAEFHCYSETAGKELYKKICEEFF